MKQFGSLLVVTGKKEPDDSFIRLFTQFGWKAKAIHGNLFSACST